MTAIILRNPPEAYDGSDGGFTVLRRRIHRLAPFLLAACSSRPLPETPKETSIAEAPRELGPLQQDMYQVASHVLELQSLMVRSEAEPKSSALRAEVDSQLASIESALSHAKTLKHLEGAPYQISARSLIAHVKEARLSNRNGAEDYARWMIQSIPTACASCHAQQPHSPRPIWEVRGEQLEGNALQRAEILFATRNYAEALALYEAELLREARSSKPNEIAVQTALRRTLMIDLRVRRDLNAARRRIEAYLRESPLSMRNAELFDWRTSLKRLAQRSIPTDASRRVEWIGSENRKRGGGLDIPQALYYSGLLLEALPQLSKDNDRALALYEIGSAEEALKLDYFFGYSRAYWRACLDQYPNVPAARSCYEALEASLRELYSGSRGYEAPDEVTQELRRYRRRLNLDR